MADDSFTISSSSGPESNPDVLIPEFGLSFNEILHHDDALGVVADIEFEALRAEVGFGALEGFVFADDDFRNAVKLDRTAAHRAGGEGGVNGATAVNGGGEPAGVFEAVHLGVVDHAAILHAAIVSASDDLAVEHEHGADGNATLGRAQSRFIDGGLEKGVDHKGASGL